MGGSCSARPYGSRNHAGVQQHWQAVEVGKGQERWGVSSSTSEASLTIANWNERSNSGPYFFVVSKDALNNVCKEPYGTRRG